MLDVGRHKTGSYMGRWPWFTEAMPPPSNILGQEKSRGQATSSDAGIPCECRFEPRLLYFPSRSLLMCLGKQPRMVQVLGSPATHMGRFSWNSRLLVQPLPFQSLKGVNQLKNHAAFKITFLKER